MYAYSTRSQVTTKHAIGATSRVATAQTANHDGAHGTLPLHRAAGALQAKLTVSDPEDLHEREADRVADAVMRMPDPQQGVTTTSAVRVERKCPTCPEASERESTDGEEEKLQTRSQSLQPESVSAAVEDAIHSLDSRGRFLSDPVRAFMEPRFGADFGNVRVHTDGDAGALAREVNAHAFTVGRSIVFAPGRYEPDSQAGRHLLAHELAHVVQQGGAPSVSGGAGGDSQVGRRAYATSPLSEWNGNRAAPHVARGDLRCRNPEESSGGEADVLTRAGLGSAQAADIAALDSGTINKEDAGVTPAATPSRSARLRSGPRYTPNGSLTPTVSGGRKSVSFDFDAVFDSDPSAGVSPAWGEVHQDIKWDAAAAASFTALTGNPVPHSGFPSSHPANVWIEDRDTADTRYGRRSGPHSAPTAGDEYKRADGTRDMAHGPIYHGHDAPSVPAALTGKWTFMVLAFDMANRGTQIGNADFITIQW